MTGFDLPPDRPLPTSRRRAMRAELEAFEAQRSHLAAGRWLGRWRLRALGALVAAVVLAGTGAGIAAAAGAFGPGPEPGAVAAATTTTTTAPLATTTTVPSTTTTTAPPALAAGWSDVPVPAGVEGPLRAVTCPAATVCYAVGGSDGAASIITSTDGGSSWAVVYSAQGSHLADIACWATTSCAAVGHTSSDQGLVFYTADGGRQWAQGSVPAQTMLAAIGCAPTGDCDATTFSDPPSGTTQTGMVRTTNGGATWTVIAAPTGLDPISAVTCPSAAVCFAAGSNPGGVSFDDHPLVARSTDGGATWAAPIVIPGGEVGFAGMACVTTTDCVGVLGNESTTSAGHGIGIWTNDGWATWTVPTSPNGSIGSTVSCSSTVCLSVGGRHHSTSLPM